MRVGLLTAGADTPIPERADLYALACVINSTSSPRPPRNLREREQFDRQNAKLFRATEVEYILVAGYPYVLTEPMLEAFPNRMIVVHNGDLTERDRFRRRRWIGAQPVLDALLAGATSTRTSLYFATADVGNGPLFLVGPRHVVPGMVQHALTRGDYDSAATYAHLHSRWMRQSWGDLLLRTIECLVAGSVQIIGDTVWVDGVPGPCRLGESPDLCEKSERRVQRGVPSTCPFIQA